MPHGQALVIALPARVVLPAVDTHWARGVSLPEALDQAKALEREEALLLARALSRSRGESLSREELVAFAESMGELASANPPGAAEFWKCGSVRRAPRGQAVLAGCLVKRPAQQGKRTLCVANS